LKESRTSSPANSVLARGEPVDNSLRTNGGERRWFDQKKARCELLVGAVWWHS